VEAPKFGFGGYWRIALDGDDGYLLRGHWRDSICCIVSEAPKVHLYSVVNWCGAVSAG
jgi:hypothetical protein